ncbi:MAG: redoxin domain-containing protein [Methylobacteriaceae bacterium]|nr:redoxin domain-containing protein [Methylobacteriaceae bacterium]MBV9219505.1 redoxin domain-containing protein [Methylobacteriaceae bacterium]MBV9634099.1 redoxin domain-containing protein [Methylobacteriaceae bacterium]MBV9703425.1 redoxin domain-containing protein [Methylobacteriaceae bacterium]
MSNFRPALWLAALGLAVLPLVAHAAPRIGAAAPDFVGKDSNGQTVRLGDLKGKIVVLEWTNDGCPYVGKWYRSGAMQQLQRDAAGMGAVWLSIASSPPGEQGYVDGAQANADTSRRNAAPAHVLLDPQGTIARLYGAQTTPHIFVIKPDGLLAYMGGADSIASTRIEDMKRAEPYAREALVAVAEGKPVPHPVTRPYGCSVKYSS